jgi:diguanylate cyclase (GGDEF)-like protein
MKPPATAAIVHEKGSPQAWGAVQARRTMLWAAGLALVILWVSLAIVLVKARQSAFAAEQRVLERMTSVVEEQARQFFSLVEFFLISTEQVVARHPSADLARQPELHELLDMLGRKSGHAVGVHLVGKDGRLVTLNEGHGTPADVPQGAVLPAEGACGAGMCIGQPFQDARRSKWLLPISHPLAKGDGRFARILVTLDLQALLDLYEGSRTRPNGSIALLRADGTILVRAPRTEGSIGRSLAKGHIWTRFLPHSRSGTFLLPASMVDQTARLTSYSAMRDLPLVVIASSALDDMLAEWWRSVFVCVALGLATSVLLLLGVRQMLLLLRRLEAAHQAVREQALVDDLTGLPNRRRFQEELEREMKRSDRSGLATALLFIDLDLFKEVNDTRGHAVGDLLLKEAAARLRACIRETDLVARLGGDEFTILLPGIPDAAVAQRVAQVVVDHLLQPFTLKGEAAFISASVGMALYPQDADSMDVLMKHGDQAMYAAKDAGRNRWARFTPQMQEAAQSRMRLVNDARIGLADNQFTLHYQPIVDLATNEFFKAEALVRWKHPLRGAISPAEFIPVLEESDLIVDLGDWVFRTAAAQAARWRVELDPRFQITFNKSPAQFRSRRHVIQDWVDHIRELGLPAGALAVEITEGAILEASDSVQAALQRLAQAGVAVSLDDFGTGYSSLSYLRKFDIDYLKIDRSFVANIEASASDAALCESIIAMARKLGVKVVAEGVETAGQRAMLLDMGCEYAQGFLFARPMPAQDFEAAFHQRRHAHEGDEAVHGS